MIRKAREQDRAAIRGVLRAAFPSEAEAGLVEALRGDRDMLVELVHEGAGGVDGYVAASAMRAPAGTAGLAPVAVAPEAQGRGIGGALVRAAVEALRRDGIGAVFVLGAPAYYGRFGFSVARARGFVSAYPAEYMMALELAEGALGGEAAAWPGFQAHSR